MFIDFLIIKRMEKLSAVLIALQLIKKKLSLHKTSKVETHLLHSTSPRLRTNAEIINCLQCGLYNWKWLLKLNFNRGD